MTQFTLHALDLPNLHRHAIGFDRMFDELNRTFVNSRGDGNYPPHNVVKLDDSHYVIEVAVAGFAEDEIDVELKENILTVKGEQGKKDTEVEYLHKGIEYLGVWVTATRYKVNDVVKYGANLWIATASHTAGASLAADEANWDIFIPGLEFEDSWSSSTQYQPGDIVTYGGYQYVGLRNNLNKVPSTETADWDLFCLLYTSDAADE